MGGNDRPVDPVLLTNHVSEIRRKYRKMMKPNNPQSNKAIGMVRKKLAQEYGISVGLVKIITMHALKDKRKDR